MVEAKKTAAPASTIQVPARNQVCHAAPPVRGRKRSGEGSVGAGALVGGEVGGGAVDGGAGGGGAVDGGAGTVVLVDGGGVVVVVVGGMGSLPGAVAAGFLLGILESFASKAEVIAILPGINQVIIYVIAIFILLMRPRGLMGRKGVMET
jgi:branched-subunit amino acid ABC-type transport system permease component